MTNIEYIKDKINAKQNILTVRKMAQKELGDINTLEIAIAEDETEIKYLKSILGDLEVLEILKKYTTIQQHTHNVWFDNEFFINGKKCSEKEYEMVRGSLEND